MNRAPHLTEVEIRVEVERIFRKAHRSRLVALHGRGEASTFESDGARWQVQPTSCELELRERLPRLELEPGVGQVFLVDWAEDSLPLDLACRLAGGRLLHVARDARLAALFGARQLEQGLAGTALAKLLLSGQVKNLRKVVGLRLSRDDAWEHFLQAAVGMEPSALAEPASLLRWAWKNTQGPDFAKRCEADDLWRATRRELLTWLNDRLGSVGVLAFCAWELDRVQRALQVVALEQVRVLSADPRVDGLVLGLGSTWLPGLTEALQTARPALAQQDLLAATFEDGLREAERTLLRDAEELPQVSQLGTALGVSPWLPAGHTARETRLAEALGAFVDAPGLETLEALNQARETLEEHHLDASLRDEAHREARRMATRLAAWWVTGLGRAPLSAHGTAWQPAIELAQRHVEDGGYVDWARGALRGLHSAQVPELGNAVQRLLEGVEALRREDDRRFAQAYVAWLNAKKPATELLPIESVTEKVVARFLEGGEGRKLLVILMDGMDQASAVQLLHWLQEERRFAPLAWRAQAAGRLPIPPVLAVAPTITSVSRSAFFAGEANPKFGSQGTDADPDRWAANRALQKHFGDKRGRLLLKPELKDEAALEQALKEALEGEKPNQRVAAVVVNAIDEDLKGSDQVTRDYRRNVPPVLQRLVSIADGLHCAVLLIADHGHVPGTGRTRAERVRGAQKFGARWRPLREGEAAEADEVALPETSWKPPGAAAVAVPWDASVFYSTLHNGEHGGLSLRETVAPALLIGHEWLAKWVPGDTALMTQQVRPPSWWDGKVPQRRATSLAEPKVEVSDAQLSWLAPVPAAATRPPVPSRPEKVPLVEALRASKVFRDHVRGQPEDEVEKFLTWLGALAEFREAVPTSEFARLCGVRPHQVAGVVARMGLLNADGFAIVEHDAVGRRVVLHRERLRQQFGVKA